LLPVFPIQPYLPHDAGSDAVQDAPLPAKSPAAAPRLPDSAIEITTKETLAKIREKAKKYFELT